MNVQAGDIARIVGMPINAGALLSVVRRTSLWDRLKDKSKRPLEWECLALTTIYDGRGFYCARGEILWIVDKLLRPIRDNPGADETLTWLSVPKLPVKEVA